MLKHCNSVSFYGKMRQKNGLFNLAEKSLFDNAAYKLKLVIIYQRKTIERGGYRFQVTC